LLDPFVDVVIHSDPVLIVSSLHEELYLLLSLICDYYDEVAVLLYI